MEEGEGEGDSAASAREAEAADKDQAATENQIRNGAGAVVRRVPALALTARNRIIRACQHNTSPRISASIRM